LFAAAGALSHDFLDCHDDTTLVCPRLYGGRSDHRFVDGGLVLFSLGTCRQSAGTTPNHYEALGFPCTLWETGNTYGGLFVDLPGLLVNISFGLAVGAVCGLVTLRFRRPLNELVERLDQAVAVRKQGTVQFSLRGLLALTGLAALAPQVPTTPWPAIRRAGHHLLVGPVDPGADRLSAMGLSWQGRVVVLVPTALLLMLAAVAVGMSLKPPLEFDKVLMYIFVCWTPQSVLVASVLTAA